MKTDENRLARHDARRLNQISRFQTDAHGTSCGNMRCRANVERRNMSKNTVGSCPPFVLPSDFVFIIIACALHWDPLHLTVACVTEYVPELVNYRVSSLVIHMYFCLWALSLFVLFFNGERALSRFAIGQTMRDKRLSIISVKSDVICLYCLSSSYFSSNCLN